MGVRTFARLCLGAMALVGAGSAQAGDLPNLIPGFKAPEFVFAEDNWYLTLGLGVKAEAAYAGSDQYRGVPFPVINLAKGKELYDFQSVDDSSSITLFDVHGFSAGPAWSLNLGRDEDDAFELAGLGDVSPTFELGGFAQWFPVSWFRLRGELRYGMGGFSGFVGNAGADFIAANGPWRFALGPRIAFGGNGFMEAFYGVTPSQSAIAGYFGNPIASYNATSGIETWGVTAQMTRYMGDGFTWGMYGSYNRVVGDAADSPLTQNANQFEFGMSLSYAFNLGKSWW